MREVTQRLPTFITPIVKQERCLPMHLQCVYPPPSADVQSVAWCSIGLHSKSASRAYKQCATSTWDSCKTSPDKQVMLLMFSHCCTSQQRYVATPLWAKTLLTCENDGCFWKLMGASEKYYCNVKRVRNNCLWDNVSRLERIFKWHLRYLWISYRLSPPVGLQEEVPPTA